MIITKQPILRKFWYPVFPESQIADRPVPFTLLGEHIVFWRTLDGAIACVKDQCCHQKVRLSRGYVEDGNLVCGYHGWVFGADGRCVCIPQSPDTTVSSKAGVASFATSTRYGYVWVALDDPVTEIPEFPQAFDDRFRQIHEFFEIWNVGAMRIIESSLNMTQIDLLPDQAGKLPGVDNHTVEQPFGFVSVRPAMDAEIPKASDPNSLTTLDETQSSIMTQWFMPFITTVAFHEPNGTKHSRVTCATPVSDRKSMILQWVYRDDAENDVPASEIIATDLASALEHKTMLEESDDSTSTIDDDSNAPTSSEDRPGDIMRRMLTNLLHTVDAGEQVSG